MSDNPKVMWSIRQIAERDGISKQAVSKIVKKLVADHDIPAERDGRGRIARLSLAHFDHHRGTYVNPAKQPVKPAFDADAGDTAKPKDSFEEARRQNEWLKLERARIEQQEQIGKLVRVDRLRHALDHAGREIQATVNRLQNRADDMALAVSKEGVHGLRVMLRSVSLELNGEIARRLDEIGAAAPSRDELHEIEAERLS